MSVDYLKQQASSSSTDIAQLYTQLQQSLEKKLYHQFTTTLLNDVLTNQHFTSTKESKLLDLHQNVLSKISKNLSSLAYVRVVIVAATQCKDNAAAIQFLQQVEQQEEQSIQQVTSSAGSTGTTKYEALQSLDLSQALIVVKSAIISRQLQQLAQQTKKDSNESIDEYQSLGERLQALRTRLDRFAQTVDPIIYSSVYRAQMDYYKIQGPPAEYFSNALLFLTYTPLNEIPENERQTLATEVGVAALLGHNIYNFGELLQHPLISVLDSSSTSWLSQLLYAFNDGDIDKFEQIWNKNKGSQKLIQSTEHETFLQQKVRIMALMTLIFNRPATERTISFKEISTICKLPTEQVEHLLMKALAIKVVKGTIDQVQQQVRITWVSPRVLNQEQINLLKVKLTGWTQELTKNITYMNDNGAAELIAVQ